MTIAPTISPQCYLVNSHAQKSPLLEKKLQKSSSSTFILSNIEAKKENISKHVTTWKDYNLQTGAAITTWVYDSQRGWLKEKVYDDTKKTKYTYYAATGMLKTREWERGVTTTYSYTDANELKLVDYSDSTTDISYTYKRDGKRHEVTDDTGTRYFDYTTEGLLDSEDYYPGSDFYGRMISIEYDNKLRKDKFSLVADSSTTLNYTIGYDLASRKNNFSNGSQSVTYARHANTNLINTKTFGTTNTVTTTVFDRVNRLKSTSTVNNLSTVLKSQAYTINRENQRIQVDLEDGNHWHFAYDYYGQVTLGEKRTSGNVAISGNSFSYAADSIGNRTSETINGVSRTFSSNLLNQYTTISGNSGLAHDDDGNMTNDGTWEMVYNGENRLIEMVKSNDKKLKFFYDYMGRRWKKEVYDWVSGAWVKVEAKLFRYDGWNLVAEIDNMNSNSLVKSYMWALDLSGTEQGAGGVGGLISMTVHTGNPISYYYIHDGNGNVSGLVNALTGVLTHTYEYDPFGNVVSGQYDGANHFRHATKYQDLETGYYRYTFRYFNAEIGRWNRRDPLQEYGHALKRGDEIEEGLGLLYGFVKNDGVNYFDLLGLKWVDIDIYWVTGYNKDSFVFETLTSSHVYLMIGDKGYGFYATTHTGGSTLSDDLKTLGVVDGTVIDDDHFKYPIRSRDEASEFDDTYGVKQQIQVCDKEVDPVVFYKEAKKFVESKVGNGHNYNVLFSNCTDFNKQVLNYASSKAKKVKPKSKGKKGRTYSKPNKWRKKPRARVGTKKRGRRRK